MMRPRRQAAVTARAKINDVLDWEGLSESSKRFRQVAAQIEAEFEREVRTKRVRFEDCDDDDTIESDDEKPEQPTAEDLAFVVDD